MKIAEIKHQLSLSQVLQHYGLQPDKHRRLHCPFHADRTPSLQVYDKTQTAYCFSSNCKTHGKSLDVIEFVLHQENCSKQEAIEKCKELIGGTIKPAAVVPDSFSFLSRMFTYFKNAVPNSKPAQDYLRSRALDATKIEVGYNTAQFHHGTRKEETLIASCVKAGLLAPWGTNTREGGPAYKPFGKYCLVFALRNKEHQVVSFYFRSVVNNSDQRHFYLKNRAGLYPGYPAAGATKLILTESIIDAATLLQLSGVTEQYSVLALYGTNGLTAEHLAAIKALPALTEIILWLNADEAGRVATIKHAQALQSLLPAVTITTVSMPDGEDINSIAQTHTDTSVFTDLFNSRTLFSFSSEKTMAPPVVETLAKPAVESEASRTPVQDKSDGSPKKETLPPLDTTHPLKLRYVTATGVYTVLGGLPASLDQLKVMLVVEHPESGLKSRNKVDLYEERQVEKLVKEISEKLSLRSDLLGGDLYRLTDLLEVYREQSQQQPEQQATAPILTVKEREAAAGFLQQPGLTKKLNDLLGKSGIVGEERNRIFLLLIALSHKMPEPLHALIQGSSGSGKTRLLKQISDCMPPESVTKLTRLSDKVLYNFPEHYFEHRLLSLEDVDGLSEEAEFALRELQSNGELNSATSIKLDNGQITSGQKTVRGPIASLACTTRGELYEDNMSRVFLLAVDESAEQTRRIIAYQNAVAAGMINKEEEEQTKGFIRQLVRVLQPYRVINPYAGQLQLPEAAHKIRRLNDLFQHFVKMVTILHQYQRKKDEKGRLVTTLADVETAIHIMFESIVLKVDELDGSLRQFFERLKDYLQKQHGKNHETAPFSLREIRQALKISKTQGFRFVQDLQQLEYIRQSGGYANRGYTFQVSYWDHYERTRESIRKTLEEQLLALKPGTPRNTSGTPEPALVL